MTARFVAIALSLAGCGSSGTINQSQGTTGGTHQNDSGGNSTSSSGGTSTSSGSTTSGGSSSGSPATAGESWLWVWYDYANSLNTVKANASSFTHISPALYQMNYDYTSGTPDFWTDDGSQGTWPAGTDNFSGLTSAQIATQIHAMGLKVVPLLFGGAANAGTDQGLKNVIEDTPAGTQAAFITALVTEAKAKGYDGWNLDWESSLQATPDGPFLTSFLTAAHTAFAAAGLDLSLDVLSSDVEQTWCSGGTGFMDLTAMPAGLDHLIIEAYEGTEGSPGAGCPASIANPQACYQSPPGTRTLADDLALLCAYVPAAKIVIGLDSLPGNSNPIAGEALSAIEAYGYKGVAVWPDSNADGPSGGYALLDPKDIAPAGSTWFTLLSSFLQHWP